MCVHVCSCTCMMLYTMCHCIGLCALSQVGCLQFQHCEGIRLPHHNHPHLQHHFPIPSLSYIKPFLSTCSLNGYIQFVLLRFALALTRSSRAQLHHLAFVNIFAVSFFSPCLLSLSGEAEKETMGSSSSFTGVPAPAPNHNKNSQPISLPWFSSHLGFSWEACPASAGNFTVWAITLLFPPDRMWYRQAWALELTFMWETTLLL